MPKRQVANNASHPEFESMDANKWYFYFDEFPCAVKKDEQGIITRVGLDDILKLSNVDLLPKLVAIYNGDKQTLSPEDDVQFQNVATAADDLSKNHLACGPEYFTLGIQIAQAQTNLLKKEFKIALNKRDAYNRRNKPANFTDKAWKKQCDAFKKSGNDVLKAVDNIPKRFHSQDECKFFLYEIKKQIDSQFDRKDLDGSRRVAVNDLLTKMVQELEFYPKNADEIDAHVNNLRQIHEQSKKVLGHGSLMLQAVGGSFVVCSAVLIGLMIGGVFAIPTGGLSLLLPAAMVAAVAGVLPYATYAMLGVIGVACVLRGCETGIAQATSNYKQVFKDMNRNMNQDIETAYQEQEKNESKLTRFLGGTF